MRCFPSNNALRKPNLLLCLLVFALFLHACRAPVVAQDLTLSDSSSGLRVEVAKEDNLPALKISIPGQPASDPGIRVLFPEHVTARRHGESDAEHLYLFRPGQQGRRPEWRRVDANSLEYKMDLPGAVRLTARATLDSDGVRFHYEFVNSSATGYDSIQAVTDPRMVSPYFRDVRLERSYVHHADGFDLLASETPARLTLPLNEWLPNRYRASYTWPVEVQRVEKKEDGLTWYNKSRRVDEPFLATKSVDGKWIMASFSREPGNVWSNPELTCQHVDMETALRPNSKASTDLKILLFAGSLDDLLAKVHPQK